MGSFHTDPRASPLIDRLAGFDLDLSPDGRVFRVSAAHQLLQVWREGIVEQLGDIVVAPDGEVWVELTAPREGKFVYRVIRSDGCHRHDVVPPPGATVIGFGRAHVFFLRTTEDGDGELLRAPR